MHTIQLTTNDKHTGYLACRAFAEGWMRSARQALDDSYFRQMAVDNYRQSMRLARKLKKAGGEA